MLSWFRSLVTILGFLRLGLLGLALVNIALPIIYALINPETGTDVAYSGWGSIPTLVTPVLAPLLLVVVLFDAIMSRVRVADAQGAERAKYLAIYRIELLSIGIMLAYWVPYFLSL
ncbi:MAG: hypothetical protein OEN02_04715 [Gammaproteobacteria bacterium]|nr:hypothetical protein [Gammaproteobacteria bacterium]MDH3537240.1 hypothetical protein [Gammaproteobacteria bacterium]